MKCREFKANHVGFVDDVLSAIQMADMRRHLMFCDDCATLDTRIRRSLLVVRNLPQIEPSADFFVRLTDALRQAPAPEPRRQPLATAAAVTVITAALAAAVYFAMAINVGGTEPAPTTVTVTIAPPAPVPMSDVAIAAAVPAGIPVWPAMFMVAELPTHFANAELLETGATGR
jgi:hypothetical protein